MAVPLSVILVEDSAADAELLELSLRRAGFEPACRRVYTEAGYLAALASPPDIVLSDYEMPQFNGMRALTLLNARELEVPFILVSGTIGEELAVTAIRQGAADYLLKDRLARLGPAVMQAIEQSRLRRDRKRAIEALQENEARYQALIRTSMDGFCVVDLEGRLREVTERFCAIEGRSADQLLTLSLRDLASDGFPGEEGERLTAIAAQGWGRFETRHLRPDGKFVELEISTVLLERRQVLLMFVRDLTDKKRLESQLLRAQRLESVGRLAGGVAHDLNNILSPVLVGASLLRGRVGPADAGLVDTIEDSARRGAAIIRQLLVFSRGAEGVRAPVVLHSLVRDMAHLMRETFPKNIVLRVPGAPETLMIKADVTQMHQVLMNLCVNARDAMPGGGTLTVTLAAVELEADAARAATECQPGSYVSLSVRDTGTGIAPEIIDQIFDPFFTTKELGQGTGLGLSTVLGIVQGHGGFIQVDSQVGVGSEFRVFLPVCGTRETVEVSPPRSLLRSGAGELVLVVDDETSVRRVLCQALETSGYRVIEATDGFVGLARFQEHRAEIRLIVTDVMMPAMDGLALVRAVRALDAAMPVVAITGVEQSDRVDQLKAAGVSSLLQKPFSVEVLINAVRHALTARRRV